MEYEVFAHRRKHKKQNKEKVKDLIGWVGKSMWKVNRNGN
jgi:hypothetical protein